MDVLISLKHFHVRQLFFFFGFPRRIFLCQLRPIEWANGIWSDALTFHVISSIQSNHLYFSILPGFADRADVNHIRELALKLFGHDLDLREE